MDPSTPSEFYCSVFKTLFKRDFESCPIEIMILLQILSTSIVWFLKPPWKGILRIVKQELLTSIIVFLKPPWKGILRIVKQELSTSIVVFLKPLWKGILQFVKQELSTSIVVFLKPLWKGILQFVKQEYYDIKWLILHHCVWSMLLVCQYSIIGLRPTLIRTSNPDL